MIFGFHPAIIRFALVDMPGVDARTAARAQPAFSLKNISHNFPEYRTSVLPIYENSAGEAALQ